MPHYFDPHPTSRSDRRLVEVNLPDIAFTYQSDAGVFSHGHLDTGTSLLLRCGIAPASTGSLCDLGCGSGAIALALALRSPSANVWALDVNERARVLTSENARRLDLDITVTAPELVPNEQRFSEIWSNPPIRIGKAAMDNLITTWLARLDEGGRMLLVISRHLGADSLQRRLSDAGHSVARVASRAGFRVLEVTTPS